MRRSIPLVLAATVALTLAACGSGPSPSSASNPAGLTTLKVGTIGIGSDAALQLAIDKGYFKEQGLDVQVSVVANPPAGVAAAQSGQLDLTYSPSIPMLNALSQNVPVTIVAAADGYADDALSTKDLSKVDDTALVAGKNSGITRPKDLEGKSVSVPARKAQLEVTVSKVIKDDGGDPAKVNWMVLDPSSAMQALKAGRVQAASLISPFSSQAVNDGEKLLASPGIEFFGKGAVGLWLAGKGTVASKKPALEGFKKAIYKANAYANANLPEAQELGAKITKTSLDVVRAGAANYWPVTVRVDDIERVDKQLVDLGFLKQSVQLAPDLIMGN
ncbi:ABC transporter substrate-binding protein [Arthrobacter sp. AZCC_0090]|uniref:ABC transporter substrate-binding protein n=1 Tax=Arthrobacter sp. AZCC_0090 TaxID=2735881 RepID=UPI001615B105|nr:ABC transporter substrate-binding protein [Arthrobacter sp. AZCC_0090]MBB6404069.1 NitT/TauT family transport system substrate-binding protein [Arthrobacter sp. AZCC_0090]